MDDATKLTLLRMDLQITTDKYNEYLAAVLSAATSAIEREGIALADTAEDGMLCVQYAAYLYRRRREQDTAMPRYLRWMLNNRKISREGTPDG
ncbi:hypothetical protein CE91St46_13520 [Eubacteriales bacterium]|jgi:predicted O-methyltransferase YrrM|nr:hypothetical protein [Faecalicatena sp. BF-R-105]GKH50241.1 hypothetical protein CE91St46_13520 [Eubacteriales bacterium]GKH62878.1 hypothetical protein CE91St47_13470 [Eubacteriales bacterium]